MITKNCLLEQIIYKVVQSKSWICLKVFLLVTKIVWQKIKQSHATESIYLLKLQQPYLQHLQMCSTNRFSLVLLFKWVKRDVTLFTEYLNKAYEKIVFWRKNNFVLATGSSGWREMWHFLQNTSIKLMRR